MLDPPALVVAACLLSFPSSHGEHLAVFVGGAANGTSGGFDGGGSAKFYT